MVPEHDKEYDILSKFILHEVFVRGTVDEIYLLVLSENDVESDLRKLLSKEEKLSAIISKVEDLLTLGLLCTFKSSAELGKTFKSCFQK